MDVTLDQLNAVAAEKNAARKEAYLRLKDHITNTITGFIPFRFTPFVKVASVNDSHVEIGVCAPNEQRGHSFDLYFSEPLGEEKRKLMMNFGCFGSFKPDDIIAVKYCEALGYFSSRLAEIEEHLLFSAEGKKHFAAYNEARSASWKASEQATSYVKALEEKARKAKLDAIEEKLEVGRKIVVGHGWNDEPICKEIERVTNKLVIFKGNYCSHTKKAKVVEAIANGKWEFAA